MRYVGAVLFGFAFGAVVSLMPGPGESWPWQPDVCMEDMACWDCTSMGNGICGGMTYE